MKTPSFTLGGLLVPGLFQMTPINFSGNWSKKTGVDSGTTTWKISISTSNATIESTNSSYGRFLYNVNDPRFTTYTLL
jgi:hypothetical protein